MKAEGSQAIIAQPIFIGYQKEIVAMRADHRAGQSPFPLSCSFLGDLKSGFDFLNRASF